MPAKVNTPPGYAPDAIGPVLMSGATRVRKYGWRHVTADITCANGLEIVVAVGEHAACLPKGRKGPWTAVEVIRTNRRLLDVEPYKTRDWSDLAPTYHHVPLDLLNRIVARNGGIARRRTA